MPFKQEKGSHDRLQKARSMHRREALTTRNYALIFSCGFGSGEEEEDPHENGSAREARIGLLPSHPRPFFRPVPSFYAQSHASEWKKIFFFALKGRGGGRGRPHPLLIPPPPPEKWDKCGVCGVDLEGGGIREGGEGRAKAKGGGGGERGNWGEGRNIMPSFGYAPLCY